MIAVDIITTTKINVLPEEDSTFNLNRENADKLINLLIKHNIKFTKNVKVATLCGRTMVRYIITVE